MKKTFTFLPALAVLLLSACGHLESDETSVPLDGASVWGGQIKAGSLMPYASGFEADLCDNRSNQVAPLLLLSDGRYIWSEEPFSFRVTDDALVIDGDVEVTDAGETLAEAYRAASKAHFPANG